jgi:hypothetical protein
VYVACLFVEVLQFAKTSDRNFVSGKLFCKKIKRRLPLGIFVYMACPGDDADEFLLPFDQSFFGQFLAKIFNS